MKTIAVDPRPLHALSPYLYMQFMEPLGTADASVDAGWDYLAKAWRPELVETVRTLSPTMIRWGGCLASYYRWKEAVGPLAQRQPMLNLCWDGLYANHVGTREIVDLCRQVGAAPLLTVNMESDGRMAWAYPAPGQDRFGTAQEAAEWVAYCNDPDNPLRIAHGDRDPYGVRHWQIGNETSYEKDGYGCEKTAGVTLDFARRMRAVDKDITLIAWGDDGWAGRVCEVAGEEIDLIAFHHHFGSGLDGSPLYGTEYRKDPALTWDHLMNAWKSLDARIAKVRAEVAPHGKKLAITECHFGLPGRNRCEVLSSWAAGVAYARCLNTQHRHGDVVEIATMADFFGNRWQVNAIMIPTPMRRVKPYFQPVGSVMALFRKHVGAQAVCVTCDNPFLDVVASRSGDTLYLHVANTSRDSAQPVTLQAAGLEIAGGRVFEIAADPEQEITELIPDLFLPVEKALEGAQWTFPPASVSAVEIDLSPVRPA